MSYGSPDSRRVRSTDVLFGDIPTETFAGLGRLRKKPAYVQKLIDDAAGYALEKLETRRLLASILLGGGVAPDGTLLERNYYYADINPAADTSNTARISLWGNITASFAWAEQTGQGTFTLGNIPTPESGNAANLYSIDVTSASPNASIAIGNVATTTAFNTAVNPEVNLPDNPYGAGKTIYVQNAVTGLFANVSTGANGVLYLGALEPVEDDAFVVHNLPITDINGQAPGLTVAPGVSFNRFFFDGTVTGRVDIGGSLGTFYAGNILTGDALGIGRGSSPAGTLEHNFNVSGDIGNLITNGDIGTLAPDAAVAGQETYLTGFRMSVTGHVGQINTGGIFLGSTIVSDSSSFKGLGTAQQEVEGADGRLMKGQSYFEGNVDDIVSLTDGTQHNGLFYGVPSTGGAPAGSTLRNQSVTNAQMLGTLFSSKYGHGSVELDGALDGGLGTTDQVDYYGIALLAIRRFRSTSRRLMTTSSV